MIVSESCHDCVRVPYTVKTYGERQKTQPPDADHRGDIPSWSSRCHIGTGIDSGKKSQNRKNRVDNEK